MGRARQRKLARRAGAVAEERRPKSGEWQRRYVSEAVRASLGRPPISAWSNGRIGVLSALEDAELPDRSGRGPQWHVSVSQFGSGRATDDECAEVLSDFGLLGAEEDNHHPGVARHFWMPVDPVHRVDCECKADEVIVVEPDGYQWTNPRDGECRGCELKRLIGRPCTIHRGVEVGVAI